MELLTGFGLVKKIQVLTIKVTYSRHNVMLWHLTISNYIGRKLDDMVTGNLVTGFL